MRPIHASLIGIGRYGTKLAELIKKVPLLTIVSCYHQNLRKAQEFAIKYGCRPAKDPKDAIFAKDIDAVIIASPDHSHLYYLKLAIEGNRHIFVEKPMVSSWESALEIKNKISSYKKVFFVGHNMRREPGFRYIKREYNSGLLGELVTFQISLSHGGAYDWNKDYWRTNEIYCREGPLRVNGVHASDVLEYLFGKIDSVYAKMGNCFSSQQAPDSGIAFTQLDKIYGTICTHWIVPSLNQFQFQFTNALVNYDLINLEIRYGKDIDCMPTTPKEITLQKTNGRLEQIEEFVKAISLGTQIETSFHEGFRAVMFFEACYRSHIQNRQISLSELTDNELINF